MAGVMESTPVLLQWLASSSPSTFLSLSLASWYLLDSVGLLFFRFPQAHAYPAMLSLALKVLPITSYMASQPPPFRRAANSSSRSSLEALRRAAARINCLFSRGLLNLSNATLHATMSAEAWVLRTQLLVGPATQAALLRLTAACRLLHLQHTAKQKQRQQRSCRSTDMGMAGAGSRSYNRSNKPRGGSSASCSSFSQGSNSSPGQSAQDEAANLLLPPDHQLMVAQLGDHSVAASEVYMRTDGSEVDPSFARHIVQCVYVLGGSADACWKQRQLRASNKASQRAEVTPAALHASVEPFCLGSAAGLQLLLEVIGLLVADGNRIGAVIEAFDLLLNSLAGASEAERRVFLTARGGLLVRVLQLGLQADWKKQQQQLKGVVETEKGAMVISILKVMAVFGAEKQVLQAFIGWQLHATVRPGGCRHVVHLSTMMLAISLLGRILQYLSLLQHLHEHS